MAVLDLAKKTAVKAKEEIAETSRVYRTQEEMKTSTIFSKEEKIESIVQYVSGQKWSVSYFLQLRNINDTYEMPDINIPVANLKYNRINNLIITLQTPISQDDPSNITGSAVINSGFVPNYGDAFIATLTGGREAVFVITDINKKLYNTHDIYDVEFKLHIFLDRTSNFYNDLVYKTVKEYYYDSDHLLDYSAPVILASDYKKKLNLRKAVPELVKFYLDNFINEEKLVISPPTIASIYIDNLLNEFIFKIINTDDNEKVSKVTRIDLDLSNIIKTSVWDAIVKRDLSILKRCEKDIGFDYTPFTGSNVTARHISYLGISFSVTKLGNKSPVNIAYKPNVLIKPKGFSEPVGVKGNDYIFSSAFYSEDIDNCGLLEKALLQYLRGEIVDAQILDKLLTEYYYWDTVDQYYLIPILLVLVKDSISNTFTAI